MKKVFVALIAVLLAAPAAGYAQLPSIGIKGGLNLANTGGADAGDPDYKAGLNIGAFVSVPAGTILSLQPEAFFSQKGSKDGDDKINLNYLEVPVLLKLDPSLPGSFVRPVFFAGPSVGILLSAKDHGGNDFKEHMKSADFGLTIGGGVEMGKLSLDARYNLGLSGIIKEAGSAVDDIKNRAITVMIGYTLF